MGAIHDAARAGDRQQIDQLIAAGADLEEKDPWRMTPLLAAAGAGHTAIVTRLLAAGANGKARDRYRNSALHLATEKDHVAVIQALLAAKASVKVGNGRKQHPLHVARSARARDLLLGAGANLDAVDREGNTVLLEAIRARDTALVSALLEAGATTEVPGATDALEQAIPGGHLPMIDVLLEAGASLNPPHGTPTLVLAILHDELEVFERLLDAGAPVERRFPEDGELLQAALRAAEPRYLNLLLDRGLDVISPLEYGWTPLYNAASNGTADAVARLLEGGVSPDTENTDGQTPLAGACGNADFEAVAGRLLAAGADINHVGAHGQTPIFTAEWNKPAASLPRFLELGADPLVADARGWTLAHRIAATNHPDNLPRLPMLDTDAPDHSGWTPLDVARRYGAGGVIAALELREAAETFRGSLAAAIRAGERDALRALLDDGADVHVLDRYWCGTLELAIQSRQLDIAALLLERGAAVEPAQVPAESQHLPRSSGPMYRAASDGFVEGLALLHRAGASLAPPSPDPLLTIAVRRKQADATAWLLQTGAPLDLLDQRGWTALHWACSFQDLPLIERLLDAGAAPSIRTLHAHDRAPEGMTGLELLLRYGAKVPARLKKRLR